MVGHLAVEGALLPRPLDNRPTFPPQLPQDEAGPGQADQQEHRLDDGDVASDYRTLCPAAGAIRACPTPACRTPSP